MKTISLRSALTACLFPFVVATPILAQDARPVVGTAAPDHRPAAIREALDASQAQSSVTALQSNPGSSAGRFVQPGDEVDTVESRLPTVRATTAARSFTVGEAQSTQAPPASASVVTLTQAIALAYTTNPSLLSARAQARSSDFGYAQARSSLGPTLTASGTYAFTRVREQTTAGPFLGAKGWASSADLVLSQPIWGAGRYAASQAGALATSEYQRESLRVTEAQIMGNVVSVYVGVRRDAQAVAIARENLILLEQQLEENKTRFSVRDITMTDLDQTRTRVEQGRAQLLQAEGQLGVSQKQFLQYVGAAPGELAPPDLLTIDFPSLERAYSYADMNSGVIRAAFARERVSRAQIEARRAEYGPRVDAQGSLAYDSLSPFNDQLRSTTIVGQVVVTQTLFDSGLRHARLEEAKASNDSDTRLIDNAYRQTRESVGAAWDDLASLRLALANYRTAIDAAERAYQGALIQQKAGDLSTQDVLDLARDLLNLRNSYTTIVADEYVARANLLAAAGLLEGPKIVADLRRYDADAHFDRVRHAGDIPLLTPALSALDGLLSGNMTSNRPIRDAGTQQALEAAMPLPPAPSEQR